MAVEFPPIKVINAHTLSDKICVFIKRRLPKSEHVMV